MDPKRFKPREVAAGEARLRHDHMCVIITHKPLQVDADLTMQLCCAVGNRGEHYASKRSITRLATEPIQYYR